jgi:hypothetical protein
MGIVNYPLKPKVSTYVNVFLHIYLADVSDATPFSGEAGGILVTAQSATVSILYIFHLTINQLLNPKGIEDVLAHHVLTNVIEITKKLIYFLHHAINYLKLLSKNVLHVRDSNVFNILIN